MNTSVFEFFPYKMSSDTGFAPNPYHGICTLACCAPQIRNGVARHVQDNFKGDIKRERGLKRYPDVDILEIRQMDPEFIRKQNIWVMGIGGIKLIPGKLIYLMQVTDILPFEVYFAHEAYQVKKPDMKSDDYVKRHGDNVYDDSDLKTVHPLPSCHDGCPNKRQLETDLSSPYVLLSDNFFYFGKDAYAIDDDILAGSSRRSGQPRNKNRASAEQVEKYIHKNLIYWGPYHNPTNPHPLGE